MATLWKAVAALMAVVGLFLLAQEGADLVPQALTAVRGLGPWAGVAFIALYAVATAAWVPASVLTLASGAIFGLTHGTLYTLAGATLGATLAFLISRHLARKALERRIGDDPRFSAIDEAIGREGPRLVFLLRLSPAFPFTLMNYALGLTRVGLRDYLLATMVGMAPGTFLYVYAGFTAGEVFSATSRGNGLGGERFLLLGIGLLAAVGVTVLLTRAAGRALRAADGAQAGTTDGGVGAALPPQAPVIRPLTATAD